MATDGKETKSQRIRFILAAALDEFVDKGFAAARLDSIAERAGVAKGTIYLYFDTKETLFEQAVRAVIGPMVARFESMAAAPEEDAETILRQMIRTLYREVITDPRKRNLLRLIISQGPRFQRLLRFYHDELIARSMAALRRVLAYGVERGEFGCSPAVDQPQIIFGPALTAAIWTILFEEIEPIDLDAYCEAHLDFMLRGLKAPA
ncbi:TetR/AcrR family transcriptional regulator [Dichotomicrobium thermohalophilum]|uniref:TetR family transcriptional regulator n=1 Tax=Dichotomicrobium thermohalophilum TaxID=933063 RepID=A0A397Q4X0_9HYPH|nr:TetR/AcrR family transcriptional regulator [Dichotomicrobium thermohalophilum]RIA55993.1 TetR family transcriptional regulator [Dichotomicrobium thermohalophilum]